MNWLDHLRRPEDVLCINRFWSRSSHPKHNVWVNPSGQLYIKYTYVPTYICFQIISSISMDDRNFRLLACWPRFITHYFLNFEWSCKHYISSVLFLLYITERNINKIISKPFFTECSHDACRLQDSLKRMHT